MAAYYNEIDPFAAAWLRNHPTWIGWEHDYRPTEVDAVIDVAMEKVE